MKFYCDKKEFSEAVSTVQRAVATKSTLTALEGILLRTCGASLELTGYDLELGMVKAIAADVNETGEVVLNAKIFSAILKKMPAGRIEVTVDKKLMTVISNGATEFTLLGIPASEFPNIPQISESTAFSISQKIIAGMIRQTIFSISTDESKPIHMGSLFELSKDQIRIVSVDGFRLAIRTEKISNDLEMKFVVPGKMLSEVLKMLDPDCDNPLNISVGKRHILFDIHGYTIVSRLLEGDFLDYRNVLGSQHLSEITANVRFLTDSVERANLVVTDKLKSPVVCNFDIDFATIKCSTAVGKSNNKIPVELSGNPCEIGFNSVYILDALHNVECDKVKMLLNGPLAPMQIVPADGDNFVFLVLPVRLKKD